VFKVGLTGGIGSGKSTVAGVFAALDVPVIDADQIAHQLVETGQPALKQIQQAFGDSVINSDGSLNRVALRENVFFDSEKKQRLESIMHPLIFKTITSEIEKLSSPYCIIAIPLLLETGQIGFVDRVLVIDCPIETQIERVRHRDDLALETIHAIINSQVPRAFRRTHADDVIDNSGLKDRLAEQVKKLHNSYLSLSACRDNRVCEQHHHL
jgi:dephospho-CoA kinase